jgi:uncharacterized protein YbaP (TraB family)
MKLYRTFLIICASFVIAQTATAESPVWQLTKNGSTIYLAGSVHVLRAQDYPLPAAFDAAYNASNTLVFEADVRALQTEPVMVYLIQQMFLPPEQSLRAMLKPETWALLHEKTAQMGITEGYLDRMKAGIATSLLSNKEIREAGFDSPGVDVYFLQLAQQDNKPIAFLESVERQIHLLTDMGAGFEDEYVTSALRDSDPDHTLALMSKLIAAWRAGQPAFINEVLAEELAEFPSVYHETYTKRNSDWVPQIDAMEKAPGTEFVIVGLAHIWGQNGLLDELKKLGWAITQFM